MDDIFGLMGDISLNIFKASALVVISSAITLPSTAGSSIVVIPPATLVAIGSGLVGVFFKALSNDMDQGITLRKSLSTIGDISQTLVLP